MSLSDHNSVTVKLKLILSGTTLSSLIIRFKIYLSQTEPDSYHSCAHRNIKHIIEITIIHVLNSCLLPFEKLTPVARFNHDENHGIRDCALQYAYSYLQYLNSRDLNLKCHSQPIIIARKDSRSPSLGAIMIRLIY